MDLDRAAKLYIESPEAQHGDLELARWEAEDWWRIFAHLLREVEGERICEHGKMEAHQTYLPGRAEGPVCPGGGGS